MPIYEYRCNKCGEVNEVLVLGKEENPACRECGSEDLVKLMSAHNTATLPHRSLPPQEGRAAARPIRAAPQGVAVPIRRDRSILNAIN